MNSRDVKPGDVAAISYCGRNVVLFRGQNGKPYVLDAYCAHMGAHLGVGGKVRYDTCIECPFHGWTFDGETGSCVLTNGKNKIIRIADTFKYEDVKRCTPLSTDGNRDTYLKCTNGQQEVRLKKYICRELNGSILVWYHSNAKLREIPLYEPFDIADVLQMNKIEGKKSSRIVLKSCNRVLFGIKF